MNWKSYGATEFDHDRLIGEGDGTERNVMQPRLVWEGRDRQEQSLEATLVPGKYYYSEVESAGPDNNWLVLGDSLPALRVLAKTFAEKVACIVIDPPYNTGQDFGIYWDRLENSVWLSFLRTRLEYANR